MDCKEPEFEYTLKEVGDEMGFTEQRAWKIHDSAIKKFRKNFKKMFGKQDLSEDVKAYGNY